MGLLAAEVWRRIVAWSAGQVTLFDGFLPSRTSRMPWATCVAILCMASMLLAPRWGVRVTLSMVRRGLSGLMGSG
jgi:hypothetical protein